jgi:hypothetical protein
MSHDQNFKNLILDYPRQALAFLAEAEARRITPEVRITPIRQEQLQERLGERFRELDVPLLVEWPTGERAALLFVIEEESDPRRSSLLRLAHYCLDIVELAAIPYRRYRDSDNLVARLNLPNMRYDPAERVDVYAAAVRGLASLEPDPERQLKYADFIDIYSVLDDNERQRYESEYPAEARAVSTYFQMARQEGRQEGEALVLLRQIRLKFGAIPDEARRRIEQADADTLLVWSERVLTADRIDDIIH